MRPVSWSSSYLFRDPLGISTTTWIGRSPRPGPSVLDEAVELIAFDQLSALEELELDQGGDAHDLAAEPLDQAGRGPGGGAGGGPAGGGQDPLRGGGGVGVQLQGGGPVLERVLLGLDLVGQLAGLADGDEAGPEVVGDRRGQDEAAGLDAGHLGGGGRALGVGVRAWVLLWMASAGGAWPGGTAGVRTACDAAGWDAAWRSGVGPVRGRPRPARSRRARPARAPPRGTTRRRGPARARPAWPL